MQNILWSGGVPRSNSSSTIRNNLVVLPVPGGPKIMFVLLISVPNDIFHDKQLDFFQCHLVFLAVCFTTVSSLTYNFHTDSLTRTTLLFHKCVCNHLFITHSNSDTPNTTIENYLYSLVHHLKHRTLTAL